MKTVYFARHAKSSWKDITLDDQDRPLNKRGKRDSSHMAEVMAKEGERPDVIITSPAVRADKTAIEFRKAFKLKKSQYFQDPRIYHAMPNGMIDILNELPDDISTVYFFAHNPCLTMLINHFSEEEIENVPTCGICKVIFDVSGWNQVTLENGKLQEFYYPKQYFQK